MDDLQETDFSVRKAHVATKSMDTQASVAFFNHPVRAFLNNTFQSGQTVNFAPDARLVTHNPAGRDIWLLEAGILRLSRFNLDGRRQILSLWLPGEIVGFEKPIPDDMSIETATPCRLQRLDRRSFEAQLAHDRTAFSTVLQHQQIALDRLRWLTWSIGALRPDERLCAFLAMACTFMPYQALPDGSGILAMLLPRLDIADLLATSVESISRITHRLAEDGVLEIRDPSHFRIIDQARLKKLGRLHNTGAPFPFQSCHIRAASAP